MNSIYYFAAWTDSGFLLGCDHEHQTVTEAVACISCADGYVIAVENNGLRALTDEEEAECQCAPRLSLSVLSIWRTHFPGVRHRPCDHDLLSMARAKQGLSRI